MVEKIRLPCYGIVVTLGEPDPETPGAYLGCRITSELQTYGSFDDAVVTGDHYGDGYTAARYHAAMEGIESLILGHAAAGVDVQSPDYVEGIESAVGACMNNL